MAEIERYENQEFQEDETWERDVQCNMTFLTQNIGDLTGILTRLFEHKIISHNEREMILSEHHPTTMEKNYTLLTTLKSKGWSEIKPTFIDILRETLNSKCAEIIGHQTIDQPKYEVTSQTKICMNGTINSKWWPESLSLPNSFFERKIDNVLMTEKLKQLLTQNALQMTVINQQVTVSGLGGIGKTTTAKSFALKYAEDYDLIFWIDCGEGSLLKSFTRLARDLRLENRKELELKELACRSFEMLKEYKCLFIFDNAECYVGKEEIRDVLPKSHTKFHVIITSRNREWGQENIDGTISEFPLQAFGEEEGLEFMKKNIKNLNKIDDVKIKNLCHLLSFLPLALQIAISTLNKHKISVDKYIDKLKNTDIILDATLDDYERTIKKTLKITLELIQNHEEIIVAENAIKILSTFGYVTPDAVESDFFIAVQEGRKSFFATLKENFLSGRRRRTQKKKQEARLIEMRRNMDEATELLQFYSLISKTNITSETYKLSIHRLFQQVIRHNTKERYKEILSLIFNCEGFLEYKLVPFTHYADKELQKNFPKLKSELIDKLELRKLLTGRRFQEAVELSRLIQDSFPTPVTTFIFALCLKYNNENVAAKKILEALLTRTKRNGDMTIINVNLYEFSLIMDSSKTLTFDLIAWELFLIDSEEKDEQAARQIFLLTTQMSLWRCSFNSSVVSLFPQGLRKLELERCTISNGSSETLSCIRMPLQLKELKLWFNEFLDDDGKKLASVNISQLIPLNINKLEVWDSICVSLDSLKFTPSVILEKCSLILVSGLYITPEELTLGNVKFFQAENQPIADVLVNDFVDFRHMKKLHLGGCSVSIDLCHPLTLNDFWLYETKVVDLKKANWTVHKLQLLKFNFVVRTLMEVTEIEIKDSSVDISVLPSTIKKLNLRQCTLVNFSLSPDDGNKLFPNLRQLYLKDIKIDDDENYVNNYDLLRFLVSNYDKWKVTRNKILENSLDAQPE